MNNFNDIPVGYTKTTTIIITILTILVFIWIYISETYGQELIAEHVTDFKPDITIISKNKKAVSIKQESPISYKVLYNEKDNSIIFKTYDEADTILTINIPDVDLSKSYKYKINKDGTFEDSIFVDSDSLDIVYSDTIDLQGNNFTIQRDRHIINVSNILAFDDLGNSVGIKSIKKKDKKGVSIKFDKKVKVVDPTYSITDADITHNFLYEPDAATNYSAQTYIYYWEDGDGTGARPHFWVDVGKFVSATASIESAVVYVAFSVTAGATSTDTTRAVLKVSDPVNSDWDEAYRTSINWTIPGAKDPTDVSYTYQNIFLVADTSKNAGGDFVPFVFTEIAKQHGGVDSSLTNSGFIVFPGATQTANTELSHTGITATIWYTEPSTDVVIPPAKYLVRDGSNNQYIVRDSSPTKTIK